MSDDFDVGKEIAIANEKLDVDLSSTRMPLDMTVRSVALTLATRHCGDTVVSEGNLYQQLKMDNKLGGPLTVDHVIHVARIFEMYLWGKWSQDIAGKAMESVLDEMAKVVEAETDKRVEGLEDEPPIRPHSGGQE